jgi:fumarate hydratase class I
VNRLGIGAQGLGGLTTVLDVKVLDYPTHAANLPVAMIPNCAATRHAHFVLDGSGPVYLDPPNLDDWPKLSYDVRRAAGESGHGDARRGRDVEAGRGAAADRQAADRPRRRAQAHDGYADRGEKLPVDFRGRFIYYVGPVDPVREEVVGPAGPTTATRMDKFTRQMLAETGLLGMVGKAERGPAAIEAIKEFGAVYLMAVGGAAYLVSKAIHGSRVLAFADLGMEAIYEFDVRDMPVTVAVDSKGTSVHQTGPAEWQRRIAGIPISYWNVRMVRRCAPLCQPPSPGIGTSYPPQSGPLPSHTPDRSSPPRHPPAHRPSAPPGHAVQPSP